MTTIQIQLLKKSWSLLRGVKPEIVADVFYSKLFFDHPELRPMFPADMRGQYNKFMMMLNIIVARLDQLDSFSNELAALAIRHKAYGVKATHFSAVGKALLWTLKYGLGYDWTPDVAEAWASCYSTLSNAMIRAMEVEKTVVLV
jgi:hemoglobin-like flavoprotein